MKKLMFAAALAAVCVPAFAEDDAGISSSIVGYVTIEGVKKNNYVPLAVQFENVAGGDLAVKDVVTVSNPQASAGITSADQIWRWNTASASWTKYFFYISRGMDKAIWVKDGETSETTDTIPCGETFFFMRSGAASEATSLTLAGGVKDLSGSTSFAVTKNQLAFVANPWPKSIAIKDFCQYSDGAWQASAGITSADQIWLWDTAANGWTKYFLYISRGMDKAIWVKDGDTNETTDEIPVGKGIFFQRSGAASLTEPLVVTFADKK